MYPEQDDPTREVDEMVRPTCSMMEEEVVTNGKNDEAASEGRWAKGVVDACKDFVHVLPLPEAVVPDTSKTYLLSRTLLLLFLL
jgi:hypothetical protein